MWCGAGNLMPAWQQVCSSALTLPTAAEAAPGISDGSNRTATLQPAAIIGDGDRTHV
jgi:hypothetical protein